jgi:family 31 glycosyl hydrolase
VDNHSQEIAMGELQSRPTAKEDRMFELLKSANLAYDRKNELFAACSTAKNWKQLMKVITPLEEGLRQRLFEVIYSSEENEDL